MSTIDPNQPVRRDPVRRDYDLNTTFVSPTDRIRWGPILAGLFAALSTLIVLGVLGMAIGLSVYDAGDPGRSFGIGAGWWGAVSALIAFFVGGWIAARGAAFRGSRSAIMNGALVWAVGVPLMLYMVGSVLGSIAGTTAQTGAAMSNRDQNTQQMQSDAQGNQSVTDRARSAAAELRDQVSSTDVNRAASAGAKGAWGTLIALLLGLGAASLGGYAGARHVEDVRTERSDTAAM